MFRQFENNDKKRLELHYNLVESIAISWKCGIQSCQFLHRNECQGTSACPLTYMYNSLKKLESLGSHISMSLKQDSYKTLLIYKTDLINWSTEVLFCLYDKYEKFLLLLDIVEVVHLIWF